MITYPREGLKQLTQEEVNEQPLLLGVPMMTKLLGLTKQRIHILLRKEGIGFKIYRINHTTRFSTFEVLRGLGYDTTELERRLRTKPMYSAAELARMFSLTYGLVKPLLETSDITPVQLGMHSRYPTPGLASWLGVEPDHAPRTQTSTSSGEPGISSCVKTKRGTVIRPGKPYRFSGKVYDGSDVIVIARALGVA
ncbi:hypothetical protein [Nocardia altamirensis]|uniref:hypothetical protein n=1 Tax=Nocardia altamirensis TaxID=472158 RepID=UPI00114CF0CA|nr:hypothetical protein [Nocardia altamirensis]